MGQQREIVLGALGEAETGVDHQALGRDAAGDDRRHALAEFGHHLGDDVRVDGAVVHVLAEAAPVHDDEGHARGGDGGHHGRVREAAADVVDQDGAGGHRLVGDPGAHGVHGHRDALGGQAPYDGYDAPQLLVLVDPRGAGARRLTADVHQVGALGDQIETALHGGGGVEPATAVREGIGRHIDDAHDRAAVPLGQAVDRAPSAVRAQRTHTSTLGP